MWEEEEESSSLVEELNLNSFDPRRIRNETHQQMLGNMKEGFLSKKHFTDFVFKSLHWEWYTLVQKDNKKTDRR